MSAKSDAALTDRDAILDALADVERGDELTIETESGYRDNRTVSAVGSTHLTFGAPDSSARRMIHRERGTLHKPPQHEGDDVSVSGFRITKLWVF